MKQIDNEKLLFLQALRNGNNLLANQHSVDIENEEYDDLMKYDSNGSIPLTDEEKVALYNNLSQIEGDIEELKRVAYDEVHIESNTLDLTDIK